MCRRRASGWRPRTGVSWRPTSCTSTRSRRSARRRRTAGGASSSRRARMRWRTRLRSTTRSSVRSAPPWPRHLSDHHFDGLRLRSHGKPRALRCHRFVPTAVGVLLPCDRSRRFKGATMTLILAFTPAGTYTNHPTLSEAIADLRQDLFDRTQNLPAGTPQRWADDDLARALDRAVDEYSFVSPLVQT